MIVAKNRCCFDLSEVEEEAARFDVDFPGSTSSLLLFNLGAQLIDPSRVLLFIFVSTVKLIPGWPTTASSKGIESRFKSRKAFFALAMRASRSDWFCASVETAAKMQCCGIATGLPERASTGGTTSPSMLNSSSGNATSEDVDERIEPEWSLERRRKKLTTPTL